MSGGATSTIDMEAGEKLAAGREEKPSIARWVVQPLICVVGVAVIFIYVNTASLTNVESRTMNNSSLVDMFEQHVLLTVISAVIVIIIAVPLGVALTRGPMRRYTSAVMAVAGFGQAAPAVGLIVLAALFFGFGIWPCIGALVVYGILPVLANVVAGIDGVDPRLVEAGRGMGMSGPAVLVRVELAIAIPVIMAGVRTALVLMVGTAALAGFVGAGGLGKIITVGVTLSLDRNLIIGGILIALLALFIDWLARVIEILATPKGLS